MMSCRNHILLAVAIIILPILASCRQELCYDHYPMLNVSFNWEQEWERDYGMHHPENWDADYFGHGYDANRPGTPEWVNMIRYYDNEPHAEHFLSLDGETYIVEAGKASQILLYNGDTEYIVVSDIASLQDARATSTSRSRAGEALRSLNDVHIGARTTNPPDVIYAAYIDNVPAIYNHEKKVYNVKMQPLVYTYVIMYEFDYGLEHVALARGAIGGMAESVYLRTGVTSEAPTIVLFDCDLHQRGCMAKVRTFGAPSFPDVYYGRSSDDPIDRKYTLNLELKLTNGKNIDFNYDISDQLKSQPRGGVIKISGIRVEAEQNGASAGFDVDVSDWDDSGEIIDLPIGNKS